MKRTRATTRPEQAPNGNAVEPRLRGATIQPLELRKEGAENGRVVIIKDWMGNVFRARAGGLT